MNLTVKQEYIDASIHEPITGKVISVKFTDPSTYEFLYRNGYEHLFTIEEKPVKKRKEDNSNDISE